MKAINYIRQLNAEELTDFILYKSPLIYKSYTDSREGLINWLNQDLDYKTAQFYIYKDKIEDLDSILNILDDFKNQIVYDKNIEEICYSANLVKALTKLRNILKENRYEC